MKRKFSLYIILAGLLSFMVACEEEENMVVLSATPEAPELITVPNLTLERTNGTNELEFIGSTVDPGFQASAIYFLEASNAGSNFEEAITILSTNNPRSMKISVSDLNGILLKQFPADQASSVDLRLRSQLVVDAGTGALGTGSDPLEYISEVVTVNVTLYGLPRLDLIGSGLEQKLESALGDGVYKGFVNLDPSMPFTLLDPETSVAYGANGSALAVDGDAITPGNSGWYQVNVDVNEMTYELSPYSIGVVGAFTDWGGNPDHVMTYDAAKGFWTITLDLPTGPLKFRLNSDWGVNWGPDGQLDENNAELPANGGTLRLPNSNGNILITSAGNYTIQFIATGTSGDVTFIKN